MLFLRFLPYIFFPERPKNRPEHRRGAVLVVCFFQEEPKSVLLVLSEVEGLVLSEVEGLVPSGAEGSEADGSEQSESNGRFLPDIFFQTG